MILLTGASGFIGKHLLTALQKEYGYENVVALTSKPIEQGKYLLHHDYTFDADYFIKNGGEHVNNILHAGAFTPKNNSQSNQWEKCNHNIYSTEKLLKSTFPHLEKFIFLSTLDVYGEDPVISENTLPQPVSLYGYSKLYCEKMILSWAKEKDKIAQVLRIGHVYGEGEEAYQKMIPVTMHKILNRQPVQLYGSGDETRSFIYINDVVNCILKSIHLKEYPGEINIAGKESISIKMLLDTLIRISKRQVTIEQLPFTGKSRNLVFDTAKMETYLQKEDYCLDTGLKAEWDYMQNLNGK